MKKKFLLLIFLSADLSFCQNNFNSFIKDSETNLFLEGASAKIKGTNLKSVSNSSGFISIIGIPDGKHTIEIRLVGYEPKNISFDFPLTGNDTIEIVLKESAEETEEIIISSTRTSRTIEDEPTRVEVIEFEEIDEKSNMRPSNVSMLLHESTGILVQQTSATSGNASIRIQGLDGRYTQLLKDGYPNFGNLSSSLSILEIPPLDLRQVEIIKGPASTLYGGGAIAGVVNFITKDPSKNNTANLLLNQSNLGATDASGFFSGTLDNFSYTLFSSYSYQKPYDVDKDDFTELAKSKYFNLSPKLFFLLNKNSSIIIGNNFSIQERTGGDIIFINNGADTNHTYFEKNNTTRNISTVDYNNLFNNKNKINLKQCFSFFKRKTEVPDYSFDGEQYFAYSDFSYTAKIKNHTLISGINFVYDNFKELSDSVSEKRDQKNSTIGLYMQDNWDINKNLYFELGIRADYVFDYETFILPRISMLYKFTDKWSSRISAGLGYKIPFIFTEESEELQFENIEKIEDQKAERSYGGTADINFNSSISNNFFFSLNNMFFYTLINDPLILQTDSSINARYINAPEPVQSLGFETNSKLIYSDYYKLFIGYTFIDAKAKYFDPQKTLPLLPKNKLNLALIFENPEIIKIGFEAYFTDSQYLSNDERTPSFWELGIMAEKSFKYFSIYLNFENFTDTKQSNYKSVVSGSHNDPVFDEIWTHTEGFSFNGGIKIKL